MPDDSSPDVAVIITTFRQREFLAEALLSVTTQTYPAAEIVVVDDGSEVPVDDIVSEFSGVVLVRQENQGVSGARNTGLAATRSPYVVFVDGDDKLLPDALRSGIESLRAHPAAPFTSGDSRLIGTDGEVLSTNWMPPPRRAKDLYGQTLRRPYVCPPGTAMFRREAIDQDGKWVQAPEMKGVEDWDFYLRLARSEAPAYHRGLIADYRVHQGQVSRNSDLMIENCLRLLDNHALPRHHRWRHRLDRRAGKRWVRAHFGWQAARQDLVTAKSPRNLAMATLAFARYAPTRVGDGLARLATRN